MSTPDIISQIIQDDILEEAYQWLCKQREDASDRNSIWDCLDLPVCHPERSEGSNKIKDL